MTTGPDDQPGQLSALRQQLVAAHDDLDRIAAGSQEYRRGVSTVIAATDGGAKLSVRAPTLRSGRLAEEEQLNDRGDLGAVLDGERASPTHTGPRDRSAYRRERNPIPAGGGGRE
jgi:hypothetical protein